jgi:poly-gamma-glutamate capsule biosynthesis protein CapA/YwtB (metallophosphatase superfamily)
MPRTTSRSTVRMILRRQLLLWCIPLAAIVTLPAGAREPSKVSIIFAGDVMLDGGPGHAIANGKDVFADVAKVLASADIAVCNLECVVAKGGRQVAKPYTFKAPPACIPVLKQHFSAVCVANNHSGDFGHEALLEQFDLLDKAKLPYFGGGRDSREAHRPLIIEENAHRIALLGYNRFPPRSFRATDKRPGVAWLKEADVVKGIRAARKEHRADIVIPFLHWGRESEAAPTDEQKQLARRLIDAGADAVIGGHAHVTQTIDIYHGKPIVYSLGNLVFDYFPLDPPVWTGWVVRLEFDAKGGVALETFAVKLDPAGIPHLLPAEDD